MRPIVQHALGRLAKCWEPFAPHGKVAVGIAELGRLRVAVGFEPHRRARHERCGTDAPRAVAIQLSAASGDPSGVRPILRVAGREVLCATTIGVLGARDGRAFVAS
jgi:hypothetical protein